MEYQLENGLSLSFKPLYHSVRFSSVFEDSITAASNNAITNPIVPANSLYFTNTQKEKANNAIIIKNGICFIIKILIKINKYFKLTNIKSYYGIYSINNCRFFERRN